MRSISPPSYANSLGADEPRYWTNAIGNEPRYWTNAIGDEPRYRTDAIGSEPWHRADSVGGQNTESRCGSMQIASMNGRKSEQNRERKHEQDF